MREPIRTRLGHSSYWLWAGPHATLSMQMENALRKVARRSRLSPAKTEWIVFRLVLPLGVLANLGLGLWVLMGLQPHSWSGWLQVTTGAFCCVVAGWLAAAVWSKAYWTKAMVRQVAVWDKISSSFFAWLEEAPLPADSLNRLKSSLDEAVPVPDRR